MQLAGVNDWEFFDLVASSRSLTEASRAWGVSVAAVSKRLATLEQRLGAQLVKRSTRALSLTDEGVKFAKGADRILRQIQDLEDSFLGGSGVIRGTLSIHATLGLGRNHIAPLLGEFSRIHPGLDIQLEISALPVNIAGTPYDIGIRVGAVQDTRLHSRTLLRQRRIVCASPDYVAAHGRPESPSDLSSHNCLVIRENDNDYALWRFQGEGGEQTVRVNGSLLSNDGETVTDWCLKGMGVMLRSEWHVSKMIQEGRLVRLLPGYLTPESNVSALYDPASAQTPRVSAVLDYLQENLVRRI